MAKKDKEVLDFKKENQGVYKMHIYRYWISMNNTICMIITDCFFPHKEITQIYTYTNNKKNRNNIVSYAMMNIDSLIAKNGK